MELNRNSARAHFKAIRPLGCGPVTAARALEMARRRAQDGQAAPYVYGLDGVRGAGTLGAPWNLGAYRVQWCERPPLRLAGDAESLSRLGGRRGIGHSGHYLDAWGHGETVAGAVYLLPGRGGQVRAVPAVACPHNPGAAALAFGDVVEGPGDDSDSILADAAQVADALAERYAQNEREHDSAYQAGAMAAQAKADAQAARRDFLELRQEAREAAQDGQARPALCRALRLRLEALADAWREAKALAARLADGDGPDGPDAWAYQWDSRDESLRGAFADGLDAGAY